MIELVAGTGGRTRHEDHQLPLAPLYLGREECSPGHSYGRVREEYLIHYVVSGTGSVHTDDTDVILRRGTAFVIAPGREHWYQADRSDPWTYWWVGFAGPRERTLAAWFGSVSLPTVVPVPQGHREGLDTAYRALWDTLRDDRPSMPPILPMRHLMTVLHLLFTTPGGAATVTDTAPISRSVTPAVPSPHSAPAAAANPVSSDRWPRVAAFLDAHFAEPITVQSLCRSVGVSRAELHRLCIAHLGHSAKRELTRRRMARAASLLRDSDRPIHRIAALCGYVEYQTFERRFKAYYHRSPGAFRRDYR